MELINIFTVLAIYAWLDFLPRIYKQIAILLCLIATCKKKKENKKT